MGRNAKYDIEVKEDDVDEGRLIGREKWFADPETVCPKTMDQIIIEAANMSTAHAPKTEKDQYIYSVPYPKKDGFDEPKKN